MAIEVFQSPEKGGMPHVFENLSMRDFQNHMTTPPPFMAIKKNLVAIMMVGWRLKILCHHTLSHFGHPFVVTKNFQLSQGWAIEKN
jgi:hypothetical protein